MTWFSGFNWLNLFEWLTLSLRIFYGWIYPEHNLKSFTDFELVRFLLLKKRKTAYFSQAGIKTIPNVRLSKIELKCMCVWPMCNMLNESKALLLETDSIMKAEVCFPYVFILFPSLIRFFLVSVIIWKPNATQLVNLGFGNVGTKKNH